MIGRAAAFALMLVLGLATQAAAQPVPAPQEQPAETADNRKILVMLRMPAPHYRSNGRYSGSYDDRAAQAARRRTAAGIAHDNGLELLEGWPMPLIGVDCYVMLVPEGVPLDAVIEKISRNRMVAWSQPFHTYETLAAGSERDDPLYLTQPAASEWQLADLHTVATGRGITVAVIDSKIETTHPDLAGQFASSRDFLPDRPGPAEGHGTGIAGVIAARSGNGVGIVGVAPGARLMALRACFERPREGSGSVSTCDSLTLAKALHYAIEGGADVINMSLSGPQDPLLASLIAAGIDRDIQVVAAFDSHRPDGGFPASMPGVISVAEESLPALPARVYRAPGRDIPTTQPGGRWYLVNGSSFAAAHVAGLLALLHEEHGASAANWQIARTAGGEVDACGTLVALSAACRCSCAVARTVAARRN